ncbi:hypothetical protein IL992_04600 [Microbispora sp. NEAU-D428]|uniref:hypothetical protein n=1 Tax=Microbispora sitophila TaxID=2771537 RepID=UPI001866FA3B|nr:hypothetical protein [Microbispora sitophila]MBE3008467.1 hypothetical protein [Microbispora sitophila]
MNRLRHLLPAGLAAGALVAAMALAAPAATAAQAAGGRATVVTALDYNSTGWTYLQVPATTQAPDFAQRGFDDSAWPTGQAGFGTTNGTCSWNNQANVKTPWAVNTDILVRHWLHLPRDAQEVRIQGTVDNDAEVYFNGRLVQSVKSGNCAAGAIDVVVPATHLDCCNLLAVRGHDYGVGAYLNLRVTYVKPTQAL